MSNCQSRASPPPTPERTSRGRAMEPSLLLLLLLLLLVATAAVSLAVGANGSPAPDGGLSYNASTCHKPFTCGPNVDIHYPFHLANESSTKVLNGTPSSSYCGYPGMAILCSANNTATLHLGIGDDDASYAVLGIDYANKTITLAAPDLLLPSATCPRVNRNVTIPQSPASMLELSAADTGYLSFFFGCAFTDRTIPPGIVPINCTGFHDGSLQSYVVPTADTPQGAWFVRANCNEVYVAPVLKRLLLSPEFYKRLGSDQGFGEVLRQGFRLTWDPSAGPCVECERSRGQCSYDQGGGFLGCLCSDGDVRSPDCGAKKQDTKAIDIGLPVAAAVLLLLLLVVSFLYIRKRRQYRTTSSSRLLKHTAPSGGTPRSRCSSNDGLESGGSVHSLPTHLFAYEELEEATDGFSAALELGDGGFGTVYKGQLRDGRVVAVKRLYNKSGCRHVEKFVNEAAILSRLRHPSLVTFYGCTSSRSRELLLVCEHVPNGTVADHLHGPRAPERALPWPVRLRVAVEAASALGYLHAVDPPVVHRDVKTGNILLDAEFHVKVADFGLSRELQLLDGAGNAAHAVSTAPQGTPGYVDPEYHRCYRLTDRSDVYSFGVVLAELVSSKPAVDVARDRGDINLAAMAVDRVQRGLVGELVDQEVWCASHGETRRMATMVAELAFRCLQQDGEMRPPIREVLDVLRGIQREGGKANGVPRSPDTVHAPWDSRTTTPSVSQ